MLCKNQLSFFFKKEEKKRTVTLYEIWSYVSVWKRLVRDGLSHVVHTVVWCHHGTKADPFSVSAGTMTLLLSVQYCKIYVYIRAHTPKRAYLDIIWLCVESGWGSLWLVDVGRVLFFHLIFIFDFVVLLVVWHRVCRLVICAVCHSGASAYRWACM